MNIKYEGNAMGTPYMLKINDNILSPCKQQYSRAKNLLLLHHYAAITRDW